jgi:hypothetical protein
MKIYIKTGDDGTTALFGGQRVGKSDKRLDCYGTLDAAIISSTPPADSAARIRAASVAVPASTSGDEGPHAIVRPGRPNGVPIDTSYCQIPWSIVV